MEVEHEGDDLLRLPDGLHTPWTKLVYLLIAGAGTVEELSIALGLKRLTLYSMTVPESAFVRRSSHRLEVTPAKRTSS